MNYILFFYFTKPLSLISIFLRLYVIYSSEMASKIFTISKDVISVIGKITKNKLNTTQSIAYLNKYDENSMAAIYCFLCTIFSTLEKNGYKYKAMLKKIASADPTKSYLEVCMELVSELSKLDAKNVVYYDITTVKAGQIYYRWMCLCTLYNKIIKSN